MCVDRFFLDPSTPEGQCVHGDVRLVNGTFPFEGRVEVCINNAWGTVCHNQFSTEDAGVICRAVGYPVQGALIGYNYIY